MLTRRTVAAFFLVVLLVMPAVGAGGAAGRRSFRTRSCAGRCRACHWATSSPDPSRYVLGYRDGEYLIQKIDYALNVIPVANVPGVYRDSTVGIDGRLVGEGEYLVVRCRASADGQYRLSLYPYSREFLLSRFDGRQNQKTLARGHLQNVRQNGYNHLELTCAGSAIAGSINRCSDRLGRRRDAPGGLNSNRSYGKWLHRDSTLRQSGCRTTIEESARRYRLALAVPTEAFQPL